MKLTFFSIIFIVLFPSAAFAKPWNFANNLSQLSDQVYVYDIRKLPLKGKVHKKVWSGYSFPLKDGGTAQVLPDQKYSPLQKLELISEFSQGAHDWEVWSTEVNKPYEWGGHCNGLSVAGIVEPEPLHDVIFSGILFTVDDIKALLIELYQGPMPVMGERCRFSKDTPEFKSSPACEDLNPASFHLALTNHLGLRGEAIIADVDLGHVVFNYPIKSFTSHISPTPAEGIELYNVRTKVTTTLEELEYSYTLEVKDGSIVGGDWRDESQLDHPDFVWMPDGYSLENPYIDIGAVKAIAKESVK